MPMASAVSRHQFSKGAGSGGYGTLTAQSVDKGDSIYNTVAVRGEDFSEMCTSRGLRENQGRGI